ncbi:MAG: hypothetical protein UY83_C0016G0010 [Candidatus Adlerbacteria bacterium GW2011_GWA1_54_10]|uniref:Uncharacterized protein n=1 Tax=Candidatus Adlerbacteria bacterium GW2011_GWA1_54_10 TaxID=1618605 RepID=A0A0G1XVH0_9BACT|nr:MAG: hypothetical protein UY83_C0016G0010 [Candidatus Adlerbacteria bacterium GW2011_GWA1_54_10]
MADHAFGVGAEFTDRFDLLDEVEEGFGLRAMSRVSFLAFPHGGSEFPRPAIPAARRARDCRKMTTARK